MPLTFEPALANQLREREAAALYRRRKTMLSPCRPSVCVDGVDVIQFCSNDYLGLANHPSLIKAAQDALSRYGAGSGASHLVSGHSGLHHELELALADFTGRDRAVLFSTGFMANTGTIQALLGKGDAIFEDKLNHASLIDAGMNCGAQFHRYFHNDMANLTKKLQLSDANRKLVVADGVFSMDGDLAPMQSLIDTVDASDASLMIDDAHGFGVLNQGRGLSVYHQDQLPIYMATLGKACGSFGAFVAGSEVLVESLIQFARSYIYTTALPPAVAASSLAALKVMQTETWRFDHLAELISHFKAKANLLDFDVMPSDTAIQPLMVGNAERAIAWSEHLQRLGFMVTAIRQPTVPVGKSRLRITLSASHSLSQLDQLFDALVAVRNKLPVGVR